MKRSAIKKKRATPRRNKMPRCETRGCTNIARIQGLCKKHAMAKADRLAREIVMQRDNGCMAVSDGHVCNGPLQWCHVWSRSYHVIRHDPRNALSMCASAHARYTHNPAAWEQFCRDRGIPWDSLRLEALHGAASWSLDETLTRLSPDEPEE